MVGKSTDVLLTHRKIAGAETSLAPAKTHLMDGEDVVQEALFEAYRKLDKFDEGRLLKPWLFRIAHNRSIDFLRKRGVRIEAETAAMVPDTVEPADPAVLGLGRAVEHLVTSLPPKERACLLLKDVFDYSLEEIAELVDSTVGGVKAALNRARTKLAAAPAPSKTTRSVDAELTRVMELYVDRFNRCDWDGVRELIYDHELAKAGIEITQFGLLTALDLTAEANQKRLSAGFAMDSTTLTRTLRLMLKQGWIRARRGKDKRERLFSLTRAGRRQLATAQPFWEAAQRRLRKELGDAGWTSMKQAVSQITGAALEA